MSAPIKRYDALGDIDGGYLKASSDGRVVLHSDHIASHAFDLEAEREAFETWFLRYYSGFIENGYEGYSLDRYEDEPRQYIQMVPYHDWMVWTLSSRSRAERFAGGCGMMREWAKDAEEWGPALNEAGWLFLSELNEDPQKSALIFNSTKGPLRAAIMKYAEIVTAHCAKGVV